MNRYIGKFLKKWAVCCIHYVTQRGNKYAKLSLGPWTHPASHGYVDIGQKKPEALGKAIAYRYSSKPFHHRNGVFCCCWSLFFVSYIRFISPFNFVCIKTLIQIPSHLFLFLFICCFSFTCFLVCSYLLFFCVTSCSIMLSLVPTVLCTLQIPSDYATHIPRILQMGSIFLSTNQPTQYRRSRNYFSA